MTLFSLILDVVPAAPAPAGGMFGDIFGGTGGMLLMMAVLFGIMYFFMIRPQQKKQKAVQEARNAIKVGDKVVTAGGIHGKVKEVKDNTFVLEIAEGIKINVEKASVFVSAADTQQQGK